ncbi:hypothetical protein [Terasakiella pusilla]|uniref:hypothetical protein n=1 Tax=Terasakiella pusilla TaxID=64973 RepID=UPI003AA99E3F
MSFSTELDQRFNGPIPKHLTGQVITQNHDLWVWQGEAAIRKQVVKKLLSSIRFHRRMKWEVPTQMSEDLDFALWNWRQANKRVWALLHPSEEIKQAAE